MNAEKMLDMIDFSLRDYDTGPENIEYIESEDRILWCTGLNSPLANRVVKAMFSEKEAPEKIGEIREFFQKRGVPFSWWIGPGSGPADLCSLFRGMGIEPADLYEGMVWNADEELKVPLPTEADIAEVETEEDVRDLVAVNAAVWGYKKADQERMVRDRLAYLKDPRRKGGFLLARVDGKAAATASYRFSREGDALYLTGASTLPEWRRGLFNALVKHRVDLAREKGAKTVICIARRGHSAPILARTGFRTLCTIPVYEIHPSTP